MSVRSFTILCLLIFNDLNAQSEKVEGYSSHRHGVYLYDVDGLKLSKIQNLAKLSNSYKENEVISCDTIAWDSVKSVYARFENQSFDGLIRMSLKIPFVLNSKLLETLEEKRLILGELDEDDLNDIYFVNKNRAKKVLGKLIQGYPGCIFITTKN